jgi:hypothetical protein
MCDNPKRCSLQFAALGLTVGALLAVLTERENEALIGALSLLIGLVWGGGILLWWQRNHAKGKGFGIFSLIHPVYVTLAAQPFVHGGGAICAMGGYGLALGIGIHLWERRRGKPIGWQELNPRTLE